MMKNAMQRTFRAGRAPGLLVGAGLVVATSAAGAFGAVSLVTNAVEPVVACVVPDAGVLYRSDGGACVEEDHVRLELAPAAAVDAVSAELDAVGADVGTLSGELDALAVDVSSLQTSAVTGVEVASYAGVSAVDNQGSEPARATAACPEGKTAVAGGWSLASTSPSLEDLMLVESHPSADGAAWSFAWYIEADAAQVTGTFDLTVTCITVA